MEQVRNRPARKTHILLNAKSSQDFRISNSRNKLLCQVVECVFDLLALTLAWHATIELRLLLNSYFTAQLDRTSLEHLAPPLWGFLILWTVTKARLNQTSNQTGGIYTIGALQMVESVLTISAVAVVVTFFSQGVGAPVSRSYVLLFTVVSYFTLVLGRAAESAFWTTAGIKDRLATRVAIIARGTEGVEVGCQIQFASLGHINVVGLLHPEGLETALPSTIPMLGGTSRLAEIINAHQLDQVIVLHGALSESEIEVCGEVTERMGIVMSHVIRTGTDAKVQVTTHCGMHFVDVKPVRFTVQQARFKRAFDLIAAPLMLILTAPVLLACAIAIKATSAGPVLYRSRRVGKGGKHFTFLKLRSMYHKPDGRDLVAVHNEKSGHIFKIRKDPRVTPVGVILRRYSLDELPQLINVIQGSMSLVGPRPLPASDLDLDGMSKTYCAWTRQRSTVLPGITGLWQIRGRSDLSFEEMVQLDIEYISHWSLLLDMKILLATPMTALSGRGAY